MNLFATYISIAAVSFSSLSHATSASSTIKFPAEAVVQIVAPPDKTEAEATSDVWTGTLISPDGLVLTCASRAKQKDSLSVLLSNGQRYQATFVGADMRTDFALIKIEAKNAKFAQLEDYAPRSGEKVFAMGATPNAAPKMSEGETDPLNKGIDSSQFIISSAQLDKGMACGPLVLESSQKVIGINTQELVPKQGPPFAVANSISTFLKISEQLTKFGKIRRGQIGVSLENLTSQDAELLGVPKGHTAIIRKPLPNSAAEAAGFLPGDVILSVNGVAVPTAYAAASILGNSSPQSQLMIKIIRKAMPMEITVITAEQN